MRVSSISPEVGNIKNINSWKHEIEALTAYRMNYQLRVKIKDKVIKSSYYYYYSYAF